MRHFLRLSLSVRQLTGGVLASSSAGRLVPPAGPLQGLPASDLGAPLMTVDIPVITPPADPNLAMAPRAVVKPIALFEHQDPRHQKGWTAGRLPGILEAG